MSHYSFTDRTFCLHFLNRSLDIDWRTSWAVQQRIPDAIISVTCANDMGSKVTLMCFALACSAVYLSILFARGWPSFGAFGCRVTRS